MASQSKTRQAKALLAKTLTPEAALDLVANGWTLKRIADHASSLTGQQFSPYYVCRFLQDQGEAYTQAKKAQAQLHAERIAGIADEVEQGTLDPASARVSSENRRWIASRLDPSTYGDRIQADVTTLDLTTLHLTAMRDAMRTVSKDK